MMQFEEHLLLNSKSDTLKFSTFLLPGHSWLWKWEAGGSRGGKLSERACAPRGAGHLEQAPPCTWYRAAAEASSAPRDAPCSHGVAVLAGFHNKLDMEIFINVFL